MKLDQELKMFIYAIDLHLWHLRTSKLTQSDRGLTLNKDTVAPISMPRRLLSFDSIIEFLQIDLVSFILVSFYAHFHSL